MGNHPGGEIWEVLCHMGDIPIFISHPCSLPKASAVFSEWLPLPGFAHTHILWG